jgi:hypothetical protein
MLTYRFATHKNGSSFEGLGSATLDDDAEALAFGRRVVQELMHKNTERYAGWTMEITEGERAVGSFPFDEG